MLCGGITLLAAVVPFARAFFHVELSYNEGWNVYNAAMFANHQLLYPVRFGWISNNYPMLSFVLFAELHRITHDYLFTARMVSLLSLLAAAGFSGGIVRALGASRRAAWLGGLFCLAIFCCDTANYVGADDPQLLAQAIFLAGLLLYLVRRESLPAIVLAALLFVIGGSVKHNPIDIPLAVLIDLVILSWRRAIRFSLCGAVFAGASVALHIHFGGPYFLAQLLMPRVYVGGKVFEQFLDVFGPLLLPFVVAIIMAMRLRDDPRRRIAAILFVTSLVVGGYFGGGEGVSINCLFTALVATAILAGLFCSRLEERPGRFRRWMPAALFAWLAIPLIFSGNWNPVHELRETALEQRRFEQEIAFLEQHPGAALCESLLRCALAGKPYLYDPFNSTRLIEFHKLDESVLVEQIARREFSAIELESPVEQEAKVGFHEERFAPDVLFAIDANYKAAMEHDGATLYLPRAR